MKLRKLIKKLLDYDIEQTHSRELQSISDALRGCAAQGGIDRELINSLVEYSAALDRIAMLYDIKLVEANQPDANATAQRGFVEADGCDLTQDKGE